MLISVHLLTGAAIGKLSGNLWIAAILSYALHHLLDSIPHYNPKNIAGHLSGNMKNLDKKDIALKSIEPVISILITLHFIFINQTNLIAPMVIGAIFSFLPDLFVFLNWKFKNKVLGSLVKVEKHFHRHTTFWPGILPQAIIVVVAIFILLQ